MPVVVGNGFGGVLFHEDRATGSRPTPSRSGAASTRASSASSSRSRLVAYDDGRMPGEWGTDAIDDEGTPTQQTTVIEEGRLTSYLYDLLRARKDGVASTGNGRRESFRHLPIPRMTNTYFAPGDATPEELIAEVREGLYAVSFGGGQVEPATGDFVFGVSEGYLIENGKVTSPCRGATLIGNGLDALRDRRRSAGDLEMTTGFCGKGGQRVPAGAGQGHVRIREMTWAGRPVSRWSSRPPPGGGRCGAGRRRGGRRGLGSRTAGREIRVHEGAVESLTEAGRARDRRARFIDGRSATPTAPTSATRVREVAGSRAEARGADADEFARPQPRAAPPRIDGLRRRGRGGRPEHEVAASAGGRARGARGRPARLAGRGPVYADAEGGSRSPSPGFSAGTRPPSCYASRLRGRGRRR